MILIFGESSSGKSSLALDKIKKVSKAFYFSFDGDQSLKNKIEKLKNIEYKSVNSPMMIDIEFGIERDVTHIVVDSINWIKTPEKKEEERIKRIISDLEYIELTYKVRVIAIYNVLRNVDSMWKIVNQLNTKKIKTKKVKKMPIKITS